MLLLIGSCFSLYINFTSNKPSSSFLLFYVHPVYISSGVQCAKKCHPFSGLSIQHLQLNSHLLYHTSTVPLIGIATAHAFPAVILFSSLDFDFNTNFGLRLYSFQHRSFTSFSFNFSVSSMPKYLYTLSSISF